MTSKTTRLNLQADRIEMVLAHHKLPALVAGGIVTPRVVRFNLHVAPHIKLNKLAGLAEEIALALGAATVRIQRDGAMVQVDPAIVVRAFIGMVIHHSLNNNLWDPARRLLNISNEEAAKQFADILLNGISTGNEKKLAKGTNGKLPADSRSEKNQRKK